MTARVFPLLASAFLAIVLLSLACGAPRDRADLVVLGAKVATVDDAFSIAEAVAVRGDRIAAVGTEDEIRRWVGDETRVIDAKGALVIPGFIDGHAHFLSLGRFRTRLDLTGARNWEEIVQVVERAAAEAEPGEWILGRGWHQEKWDRPPSPSMGGMPVHDALSRVSPENPVRLRHASGHVTMANERAMRRAAIGPFTPHPPGGEIVRDGEGRPTGLLRENADDLVLDVWKRDRERLSTEEKEEESLRIIGLAERECLAHGVTSFQDAGSTFEEIDRFRRLAEEGRLRVRLWVMIGEENDSLLARLGEYRIRDAGGNRLTVRAIKRYMDGALGAHTAWMLAPYDDAPETTGMPVTNTETLRETARIARDAGFQLCVHSIGDRANRTVLDVYEEVLGPGAVGGDHRWRIEHAQHLHPSDIPRFAALGVIASMQGIHCVSDGPWVTARIGEQRAREGAYAWRSLLDAGAVLSNGTDAPVEGIDPIAGFLALTTRRLPDGTVFHGEQRLTREEALRAYTIDAARAAFEEGIKGSIEPGKLADLTVLSEDILVAPEERIRNARVLWTILGGKVEYAADGTPSRS